MTNIPNNKQAGITILLMTIALLLITMLLILFASQYSSLQQKISSNLYSDQQAFEAAQAGLEAAIPYFETNYTAITAAESGGFLTPYLNSSTQDVVLDNSSQYTFVYSNPTASHYQLITITSTGVSADGTSTRVISQQIQSYTVSITPPTTTMTIQGDISLKNSAWLNNNQTNSNIIAGGTVTFTNSAQTTTASGVSSNSSKLGPDVQENNATLAGMSTDDFFQSIFGVNQATVQSAATYTYTNNTDTSYNSLNGVKGAIIWINQTGGTAHLSNATTLGTASQPVILIVSGNLDITNSVAINGLIFVMNSTTTDLETNSVTVNGAIAATGNFSFSNSATFNYSSSVLNALPSVTGSSGSSTYAKVPGSWKDF